MGSKLSADQPTPLMRQYWEIKSAHMDKILLFRMGDFFEIFHEDAERAAPILGIALTVRNKKAQDETKMCGVPHHSVAGPINKLLSHGYKVAICDQIEDPKLAKGIVKRAVTRILSPGMVYDPDTLDHQRPNYLASGDPEALSFLDTSTGEAFYFWTADERVRQGLLRVLQPSEMILPAAVTESENFANLVAGPHCTPFAEEIGEEQYPGAGRLPKSARRLLAYAVFMQGGDILKTLAEFVERPLVNRLELSSSVLRHLEIFTTYRGEAKGSLFNAVDRTRTSGGARLLKQWLNFPLADRAMITKRQDAIGHWHSDFSRLKKLREILTGVGDLQRRVGKISHPNCNPRDVVALADSLQASLAALTLANQPIDQEPSQIDRSVLVAGEETIREVRLMLVDEPPVNIKGGQYIRQGYHAELDEWIRLSGDTQKLLLEMEAREREQTTIPSLKIRYNNVFGYYIEVTHTHRDKVPAHYRRKQTLANAERYVTSELDELEQKVLSAQLRRLELEQELFKNLRAFILARTQPLLKLASQVSELDVISAGAWLAHEHRYCRPLLRQERELRLLASRHPVVEQEVGKPFTPNDILLAGHSCLLLTGPNMAGKSTLMRQVALTVVLAQCGYFVPAKTAELPVFDRIFTRIGASDFLTEGLSTFMVEMQETAEMLAAATSQSLVVLDEVGRGTSTYDGMSLAQAILEYLLVEIRSTTLFATHYHELTSLAQDFRQIQNAHMSIREQGGQIHFLHTLKAGPANKSYGIHVARLAGIPDKVTQRALGVLRQLESDRHQLTAQMSLLGDGLVSKAPSSEPPFFAAPTKISDEEKKAQKWLGELQELSIQSLTPLEALNRIAQWQKNLS